MNRLNLVHLINGGNNHLICNTFCVTSCLLLTLIVNSCFTYSVILHCMFEFRLKGKTIVIYELGSTPKKLIA